MDTILFGDVLNMNFILFGDIFHNNIIKNFIPIDLYNLTITCKYFKKIITLNHIKKSTINEIYRRLRIIFRSDFDELIYTLKKYNAVIAGSFIIQCILGEYWKDSIINIHVVDFHVDNYFSEISDDYFPNISFEDSDDVIGKKLIEDINVVDEIEKSVTHKGVRGYLHNKNYNVLEISSGGRLSNYYYIKFKINNNYRVNIIHFMNDFACHMKKYYSFDICHNMYHFGNDNISISGINKIFTKHINIHRNICHDKYKKSTNCAKYIKYHKRGFSFYCNINCTKTKLNDITFLEIFNFKIIDAIAINKNPNYLLELLDKDYNFIIEDNIIYCSPNSIFKIKYLKMYETENFNVDQKSSLYYCKSNNKKCIIEYLYPGTKHFHFIKCDKYSFIIKQTLNI
jgi:hypothetical protein